MRVHIRVITLTAATLLVGCVHRDVPIERFSHQYNQALHASSDEQLLLNMLRLKYGEPRTSCARVT